MPFHLSAFSFLIVTCSIAGLIEGIIVEFNIPVQNHNSSNSSSNEQEKPPEDEENFHEVDAFGDDYADFGAHTGANGAFYWHANFPVEDRNEGRHDYDDDGDDNSQQRYDFDYDYE